MKKINKMKMKMKFLHKNQIKKINIKVVLLMIQKFNQDQNVVLLKVIIMKIKNF